MRRLITIIFFTFLSCVENKNSVIIASEFFEKLKNDNKAVLIDVRTPEEFNKGHLRNALNVNWFDENFEKNLKIFSKDLPIYVYCLSGGRSSQANEKIKSMGFENVFELEGGILEWRKNNLPESKIENNLNNSLTVADFNKLIDSDKIVLVDYYADWCAPCKIMEPYLDEISNKYSNNLKLVRINYDDNLPLVRSLEIYGLPVLQLFIDKISVWSHVGYIDQISVEKELKKHIK